MDQQRGRGGCRRCEAGATAAGSRSVAVTRRLSAHGWPGASELGRRSPATVEPAQPVRPAAELRPRPHQNTAYRTAVLATTPAAHSRAPRAGVRSRSSRTGSCRGAESGRASVETPMNAAMTKNVIAMW